jgi:hypothetical protein
MVKYQWNVFNTRSWKYCIKNCRISYENQKFKNIGLKEKSIDQLAIKTKKYLIKTKIIINKEKMRVKFTITYQAKIKISCRFCFIGRFIHLELMLIMG